MKVVVTLGSDALVKRGEPMDAKVMQKNVAQSAAALATIARAHRLVVIHSTGPQAGLVALKSEAYADSYQYPLDVLTAEAEGLIGSMIQQELANLLPKHTIVALLTRVLVKENDPAFKLPAKPIGANYSGEQAERMEKAHGWTMVLEGLRWRRVVPSPEPVRILELNAIRLLLKAGAVVICAGGGGIPVMANAKNEVRGVEAVIEKDLVASLLARKIEADALLLLTDVEAVFRNWGAADARPIRETTPSELRRHVFAPWSMAPKVKAACRFIDAGGKLAGIGRLEDAGMILHGLTGTIVRETGVTLDFVRKPRTAKP
ncbi:MAG: carbamate kinase [Betaproteobacteria bacterium]|nr:carbamate kinase [Betaproteobacteria bacterium]MDH3435677.1 carbamate kinase [Betaproteobacteria bacterium]